jgi:energy-coupling factor transporter ATP-binding protein EcfA2
MDNSVRTYISKLIFNNGESLDLKENDIVLFVGPNNAGKSQSLNDIYVKCQNEQNTIVVSDINIEKGEGSLLPILKRAYKLNDDGKLYNYVSTGYGKINFDKERGDEYFKNMRGYDYFRNALVARLNTENRLSISAPAKIVNRNQTWSNPIHYAAYNTEYAKWISDNFCKAFGTNITANSLHGAEIPMCMGPTVKLEGDYGSELERQNDFADKLESYKQVHLQGDGIRSFTGILLYLMLDYYRIYLIDEPESFLHPPQARIMGQIIGNTLRDNQQAFISTHSEDIVKGLLDTSEERLKIVRITREKDVNSFSILDNRKIKDVFCDPLLKYSNIMSSLFHKTVVLCESDSDCKLYSLIESNVKLSEGKYSETLFIHCGGKHRMSGTAEALLSLNIDVRLIPDMDVLNDEKVIKSIAEVFGINWDSIKADVNILSSNLHSPKEKINRVNAKNDINRLLDSSNSNELSDAEIKEINGIVKKISKWDGIKYGGKLSIPAGDATNAYNRLERVFRDNHIYIVPVGELEGFVKEVGGHGPDWVNKVLETYPDLNASVYQNVRDFIRSIGL